jgi:hypothetical protein
MVFFILLIAVLLGCGIWENMNTPRNVGGVYLWSEHAKVIEVLSQDTIIVEILSLESSDSPIKTNERPNNFSLLPGDIVEARFEGSSVPGIISTILNCSVNDIVWIARFNNAMELDFSVSPIVVEFDFIENITQ